MSSRKKPQEVPQNLKWEGEKNLKFFAKRHDKRFGDISIYQNKRTNQKVMCKEKASGDMKQFTKDVRTAQQRMSMQNQYLHKMLGWSTQTKKELCSTHHYVKMFYEYPPSDLRNETAQRKKNKSMMTENELSNATSNALNGLDYLHAKKLAHGDIRPQLISANRVNSGTEANKFELLDRLADPSPLVKCQINNMMNNKELFMSPQLWKHINTKGKKKPPFNRQKNDLFALGMSVLSAGNQTSMKNCYKKGGKFDATALDAHLKNFGDKYRHNSSLTNVVKSLVTLEEGNRPDTALMLQKGHQPVDEFQAVEYREDVPFQQGQNLEFHEQVKNTPLPPGPGPNVHSQPPPQEFVEQPPLLNVHKKKLGEVAQNVENTHKKAPDSQKVVEGDTFFSNPTPVYQPYQGSTYIQAENKQPVEPPAEVIEYVEKPVERSYEQTVNTTPTYTTPTYTTPTYTAPTYSTPTYTTPQVTHTTTQPTYVSSTPTYVSSQPTTTTYTGQTYTTPTYSTPSQTIITEQPKAQVRYETPTTTTHVIQESTPVYTESPKKSFTSYTQGSTSEYRSSQPTNVTSQDGSTITYGTPKVVRTYVDHSSRRSFRKNDNAGTFTVQKEPHVETIVKTSPQVTYTEPIKSTVVSQPVTTTTLSSQPVTTTTVVNFSDEITL